MPRFAHLLAFALATVHTSTAISGAWSAKVPPTQSDAENWKTIGPAALTPDGRWFVYYILPDPYGKTSLRGGDCVLVVRQVTTTEEHRFPAGKCSIRTAELEISQSGRWIAFQIGRIPNAPSAQVGVINLSDLSVRRFEGSTKFEFLRSHPNHLVTFRATSKPGSEHIGIHDLLAGTSITIGAAKDASIDPSGTHMAWANQSGLQVLDFTSGQQRGLDSGGEVQFRNLTWSDDGSKLALFREANGDSKLAIYEIEEGSPPRIRLFRSDDWTGYPQSFHLVGPIVWRKDGAGVFVNVQAATNLTLPAHPFPNLRLWHFRDERLPSSPATTRSYLAFASLAGGGFVQLADEATPNAEPALVGRYVLAYSKSAAERHIYTARTPRIETRNYYLVDLKNGHRLILEGNLKVQTQGSGSISPTISPNGQFVIYQVPSGDLISYDTDNNTRHNLTASLPTSFVADGDDLQARQAPNTMEGQGPLLQGWSKDGKYVLVSDYWDIYALPLRGGAAINLTGQGKRNKVSYRLINFNQSGHTNNNIVDLRSRVFFKLFDTRTGFSGLGSRSLTKDRIDILYKAYANVNYVKADDTDVYLMSRMTSVKPLDYFFVGDDWKPKMQITDVDPQQRSFLWSPGNEYITYRNKRGEERRAILYLPAGYDPSRTYPTIVQIYLTAWPAVHQYRSPFIPDDVERYTANGYAVLQPDIYPRVDDAGEAAVDDVTSAVNAAIRTGVVNRNRLGLTGHSHGAYETLFIVSQTNMFRAAQPSSGPADLISKCGSLYNQTTSAGGGCESNNQPFMSGPIAGNWEIYLRNSPIFHAENIDTPLLIWQGGKDTAVLPGQSLEMFFMLRRLNKPVVLLEYMDEGHELRERAAWDAFERAMEFFDHFLKGAPAPAWWSDGKSLDIGQVPRIGGVAEEAKPHFGVLSLPVE